MECPQCGAELRSYDTYGTMDWLLHNDSSGYHGEAFTCPNNEGFLDLDEADTYLEKIGETLESLGLDSKSELQCLNDNGGTFYHVDNEGNFLEGNPFL